MAETEKPEARFTVPWEVVRSLSWRATTKQQTLDAPGTYVCVVPGHMVDDPTDPGQEVYIAFASGDPSKSLVPVPVIFYNRLELDAFLDGVKNCEFDDMIQLK